MTSTLSKYYIFFFNYKKYLPLKYIKPKKVDTRKQNKTITDTVKISTPAISSDFCVSSISSGEGQLSSQSVQLQAAVLFYNLQWLPR